MTHPAGGEQSVDCVGGVTALVGISVGVIEGSSAVRVGEGDKDRV